MASAVGSKETPACQWTSCCALDACHATPREALCSHKITMSGTPCSSTTARRSPMGCLRRPRWSNDRSKSWATWIRHSPGEDAPRLDAALPDSDARALAMPRPGGDVVVAAERAAHADPAMADH
jgi:hypothetical protein